MLIICFFTKLRRQQTTITTTTTTMKITKQETKTNSNHNDNIDDDEMFADLPLLSKNQNLKTKFFEFSKFFYSTTIRISMIVIRATTTTTILK